MKKFACAVAVSVLAATCVNAAAVEQDDWGFTIESNNGSTYSQGAVQAFGTQPPTRPSFGGYNVTPFRAPQYRQPVYGAQPYYTAPYYAPGTYAPPTGWVEVYRAPSTFGFY